MAIELCSGSHRPFDRSSKHLVVNQPYAGPTAPFSMPRRTQSRLEQLRRHNNRTHMRDRQSVDAYYNLLLAQKYTRSINVKCLDKVLKDYYTPDLIKSFSMEQNSALSFYDRSIGKTSW